MAPLRDNGDGRASETARKERPMRAGELMPSKSGPCNSFETMKSRMMDHGSEPENLGLFGEDPFGTVFDERVMSSNE